MKRGTVRAWYWVHKWTSLVCTLFLLMLCVTGLPLIFGEEIYHISTGGVEEVPAAPAGATPVKPDRFIERSLDRKSGVSGKSVSVRVDLGGHRVIKKKKTKMR